MQIARPHLGFLFYWYGFRPNNQFFSKCFLGSSPEDVLTDFREGQREGEKEREREGNIDVRNIDLLPLVSHPTGD